jgi:hypothetical protein
VVLETPGLWDRTTGKDERMRQRPYRRTGAFLIAGLMLLASIMPALAVIEAEEAFLNTWARTDDPVQSGDTVRTWMWGPEPITPVMSESYREHPAKERPVQYWDKSRMEVNDPNADPNDHWYVTNGLLAKELMTGRMQFGDVHHEQYDPANIQIAGDPSDGAPTYEVFGDLMDVRPVPPGSTIPVVPITRTINAAGDVGDEDALSVYDVMDEYYVPQTEHTVASVFWEFMNSSGTVAVGGPDSGTEYGRLFADPFYAVGLPLTEAFWVYVEVDSEPQWVLVQAFERRVLTYTPFNADGWQVEAGNVGQHYYEWRYGEAPADAGH